MKEALITGSEGFAGQHLYRELKENDFTVSGTTLLIPDSGLPDRIYQCDILNKEQLFSLIQRLHPDIIFHLAAQPKPGLSFDKPQLTFEINTIGTVNLLEVVRSLPGYRPRIFVIGTADEHGPLRSDQLPIAEDSPLNPINPYSISKVANWHLVREYVRSFDFDIIYPTPLPHTGPGQGTGFIAPDVASQIVAIERGEREAVVYTGDLSSERDFTDVRDVVHAYRLLIDKGVSEERYIICSGKSTPVKRIVEILLDFAKMKIRHEIDPQRNRPSDTPVLYGSHAKLTQATGWKPEIPLEQTLSDLLDWYRAKDKA